MRRGDKEYVGRRITRRRVTGSGKTPNPAVRAADRPKQLQNPGGRGSVVMTWRFWGPFRTGSWSPAQVYTILAAFCSSTARKRARKERHSVKRIAWLQNAWKLGDDQFSNKHS